MFSMPAFFYLARTVKEFRRIIGLKNCHPEIRCLVGVTCLRKNLSSHGYNTDTHSTRK